MSLELLRIYNARSLSEYTLNPHFFFNIIYGSNGVGKTTILESIYLLLRARTFRSSKYKSFINNASKDCTVFSKFSNDGHIDYPDFTLGISRSRDNSQPNIHLNSKKINTLSVISNLVILGLITPDSFNLLDSGPVVRRKFIDWGVFHVEPTFFSIWRSFKKTLNNRNLLLKQLSKQHHSIEQISSDSRNLLDCWNPQLVDLNNKLDNFRQNQINHIEPEFKRLLNKFSPELSNSINLSFYRGWNADLNYDLYLVNKLNEDLNAGTTRYGTHRSELRITYNNNLAKDILSRGQKKIIIICLILSQFSFLKNYDNNIYHNLLLLDDIDSELDKKNLKILFDILFEINSQTFISSTDKSLFSFLPDDQYKMFHVEPN